MSSPKRVASKSPKRAPKRSKITKLIPSVVDAIADAETLPADLRTLLKLTLPVVLSADKADRGPYEVEVVDQAQKSLAAVLKDLEGKHAAALAEQNKVIAPSEMDGRAKKKQAAEAALEAAKAKHEACKEAKKAAEKVVHDAHAAQKAAEHDLKTTEKDVQALEKQKATLSDALTVDFALLKDSTSAGAQGKKAMDKVLSLGKQYKLDSTILQTFPISCKKPAASRSEFETMMFTSLQAGFTANIDGLNQKLAEIEPVKNQKTAAVAGAKDAADKAEAALTAAAEAVTGAASAQKDATKEVTKAESFLSNIWEDMRKVCDAQDDLAAGVTNFKDNILTAFQQLKEKEPEPEPVEPVEEAPLDAAVDAAPTEVPAAA